MPKKLGFTLVELLIVVSLIAILAAVGLATYITFIKNARDVRRQSDLKLIQSSLEQYHADQKYYPFEAIPGNSLTYGTKTYLNKIPNDPQANPDYFYKPSGSGCSISSPQNCTNYCLFAKLENVNVASDPPCTPSAPYSYGVSRP